METKLPTALVVDVHGQVTSCFQITKSGVAKQRQLSVFNAIMNSTI